MIIVSDTTPLSELAKIGKLTLLRDVWGRIIIPREVYDELKAASIAAVRAAPEEIWIEVREVSDPLQVLVIQVSTELDLGECAAFLLAEQLNADVVMIDDLDARQEAFRRGLQVIGTIGVVSIAKQLGLIPSVKEVLDDLMANGMRIGQKLYQDVLTAAGE